ncbi:uncharacterized protein LOC121834781 [Ixodes scapularis]|uniref:uncharacterized protein LOC121834781 n=1 Tax=Ixodes scapularis TaxID=6945 RepID=UPI001A9CE534|nr:uncharacterized protein LOC121834781 [Ixodes scapularis]
MRHRVSDQGIADLLDMQNIITPGRAPTSKYLLLKTLGADVPGAEKHFYCMDCLGYLGRSTPEGQAHCENCERDVDIVSCPFFLVMPLKEQIERILAQQNLKWLPQSNGARNTIGDVKDGIEHARLSADFSTHDISLLWNTDGIRVFEKSSFDIWPVQCEILQLDPAVREQNMLMPALWFGFCKPNMTTLLTPFTKELQELSTGFSCVKDGKTVHIRVFAAACSVDAIARSAVRNCKQFNGFYGCGWCYHPGGSSYEYLDPPPERRTAVKHLEEATSGTSSVPANGVKGPCIAMTLPRFDVVDGFIPDYQHCACLGVMRQLLKLWLESEYHECPWYIGTKLPQLNGLLLALSPPTEITRTPRKFEDRAYWKASELRALMLFYGYIVLKPILPLTFFRHFSLLSYGMYLLLKDDISERDLTEARALLEKFVVQMGTLYGETNVSYNVHQLLHLTDSVEAWGPLWATSCFPFEGRNAILLNYFAGTQYVAEQIARTFILWQNLVLWAERIEMPEGREFFERMVGRQTMGRSGVKLPGGIVVYRRQSCSGVNIRMEVVLENHLGVLPPQVKYYHRFQCGGILWHSESYCMPKRVNCVAELQDGSIGILQALAVFEGSPPHQQPQCLVLIEKLELVRSAAFRDNQLGICFSAVREGTRAGVVTACSPDTLKRKCVVMERTTTSFLVVALPNQVERD